MIKTLLKVCFLILTFNSVLFALDIDIGARAGLNLATISGDDIDYMMNFLNIAKNNGVKVLVTDYCSTPSKMDDSYAKNSVNGFISFAADSRELDRIPTYPNEPYNVNADDITTLQEAKNFLYLLAPDNLYSTKSEFVSAIAATNYDAFIIDLFLVLATIDARWLQEQSHRSRML